MYFKKKTSNSNQEATESELEINKTKKKINTEEQLHSVDRINMVEEMREST